MRGIGRAASSHWLAGCLVCWIGWAGFRAGADTVHDAALDFSLTNNPAGAWSYGYATALGGNLILFADRGDQLGLWYWRNNLALGAPNLLLNTNHTDFNSGSISFKAHTLAFHPGPQNQYSVFRFTVPAAGRYDVAASFWVADSGGGGTSTDVHVLLNGRSLFDGIVAGTTVGVGPEFKGSVGLAQGDRVDFAVGYGLNGNFYFDSTGLKARLTHVTNVLSIRQLPDGRVELSWPEVMRDHGLEYADVLASTGWRPDPHVPVVADGRYTVVVEPVGAQRYFRLRQLPP